MRIALHNLGCKVNSYELDIIAGNLRAQGHTLVPFSEDADVYIVNTCTVTNIADRKSRQMLHRAKKQNPEALVIAIGCYVDTDPGRVEKDDCIDIALGNRDKMALHTRLAEILAEKTLAEEMPAEKADAGQHPSDMDVRRADTHTRAFVKIQDGCNLFCTYCIIPYARGRCTSRPQEEVLREIRTLAARGFREVVLTGIHISSYGLEHGFGAVADTPAGIGMTDTEGQAEHDAGTLHPLVRLVLAADGIDGIERIRLGSLEPRLITPKNVSALARAKKLCPHFHLSLQSGADSVLARMRRHYTTAAFADSVHLLRKTFARPALTADIIAGFPGETEEEHRQTLEFAERMDFYEAHIFPYSARKGTVAAGMPGQLTEREKKLRANELISAAQLRAKRYRQGFLGEKVSVLTEEIAEIGGVSCLTGYTERYVRVALPVAEAAGQMPGGFVQGRLSGWLDGETLRMRPLLVTV